MQFQRLLPLLALFACSEADKGDADPGTSTSTTDDGDPGTTDDGDPGTTDDGDPDCTEGMEVGQCPPDFTLIDGSGAQRSLSELRGAPVLIVGTAEW